MLGEFSPREVPVDVDVVVDGRDRELASNVSCRALMLESWDWVRFGLPVGSVLEVRVASTEETFMVPVDGMLADVTMTDGISTGQNDHTLLV